MTLFRGWDIIGMLYYSRGSRTHFGWFLVHFWQNGWDHEIMCYGRKTCFRELSDIPRHIVHQYYDLQNNSEGSNIVLLMNSAGWISMWSTLQCIFRSRGPWSVETDVLNVEFDVEFFFSHSHSQTIPSSVIRPTSKRRLSACVRVLRRSSAILRQGIF